MGDGPREDMWAFAAGAAMILILAGVVVLGYLVLRT